MTIRALGSQVKEVVFESAQDAMWLYFRPFELRETPTSIEEKGKRTQVPQMIGALILMLTVICAVLGGIAFLIWLAVEKYNTFGHADKVGTILMAIGYLFVFVTIIAIFRKAERGLVMVSGSVSAGFIIVALSVSVHPAQVGLLALSGGPILIAGAGAAVSAARSHT